MLLVKVDWRKMATVPLCRIERPPPLLALLFDIFDIYTLYYFDIFCLASLFKQFFIWPPWLNITLFFLLKVIILYPNLNFHIDCQSLNYHPELVCPGLEYSGLVQYSLKHLKILHSYNIYFLYKVCFTFLQYLFYNESLSRFIKEKNFYSRKYFYIYI